MLHCEERGLVLCSSEEYLEAHERSLHPPPAYAVTRTTTGCGPNRHVLVASGVRYMDESDHCHDNRGCWKDRYFRRCNRSERIHGPPLRSRVKRLRMSWYSGLLNFPRGCLDRRTRYAASFGIGSLGLSLFRLWKQYPRSSI